MARATAGGGGGGRSGGSSSNSSSSAASSLMDELMAQPRAKANNAMRLLGMLTACSADEATTKAIIRGLAMYFIEAGHSGELLLLNSGSSAAAGASDADSSKRRKLDNGAPSASGAQQAAPAGDDGGGDDGPAANGAADAATTAEAQYRAWLARRYEQYKDVLLGYLTGSTATAAGTAGAARAAGSAAVQVCAAAALMECVRVERGGGTFAVALYGRLLGAVLCSPAVRPEVFSLFFTKFLHLADVRYYSLSVIRALAVRYAARAVPTTEEEADGSGAGAAEAEEAEGAALHGAAEGSGHSGGHVSVHDLARNAFDVLSHMPEAVSQDPSELQSWCGAVEFKVVSAAADKNESARDRRKRQQQHAAAASSKGIATAAAQQQRSAVWANSKNQKRLYGDAWMAFLQLPLPADVLRKALVLLPTAVIPHINSPHLLADFLTHCLDAGSMTGMLALNGLFLLVTRHGLEYPQFFARLYQLLVPETFVSRHRAQFFRLADIFLTSSLVPAYTVAAFVKRFARLAMTAPPAGALVALAFMHNLIRRHASLMVLLHNPRGGSAAASAAAGRGDDDDADGDDDGDDNGDGDDDGVDEDWGSGKAGGGAADVYDEKALDPAKSRAVESSLWELTCLRNHYCPQVSAFCAVLDKDLSDRTKTSEVDLEPLLGSSGSGSGPGGGGSYAALIRSELDRKMRKPPAVAFYAKQPAGLFDMAAAEGPDAAGWGGWALAPAAGGDGGGGGEAQ